MDPRGDRRRQSDYSLPASFIFIFNTRWLHLLCFFLSSPADEPQVGSSSSRSPRFNRHGNKSINWLHSSPTSAVIEPWQEGVAGGVAGGRGRREWKGA